MGAYLGNSLDVFGVPGHQAGLRRRGLGTVATGTGRHDELKIIFFLGRFVRCFPGAVIVSMPFFFLEISSFPMARENSIPKEPFEGGRHFAAWLLLRASFDA